MSRKRVLAAKLDSEAAVRAMAAVALRQAPTFCGLCDAQLCPYFLNAAARDMVGLSLDADITAYRMGDFFIPQHRILVEKVGLPTVLRDGRWVGQLCFRHLTEPGRQSEMYVTIFALRYEAGDLLGAAVFAADISAHKGTERALRDQQVLLASVLDNLPLGVGVYDRDGHLTHSNQRMRDYTGLARLPSREPASWRHWRSYDPEGRPIPAERYPGARATPGRASRAGDGLPARGARFARTMDAGQRRPLPPRRRRGRRSDRRRPRRGRPQALGRADCGSCGGTCQPVPLPRGNAVVHPRLCLRLQSAAPLRLCEFGDARAVRIVCQTSCWGRTSQIFITRLILQID